MKNSFLSIPSVLFSKCVPHPMGPSGELSGTFIPYPVLLQNENLECLCASNTMWIDTYPRSRRHVNDTFGSSNFSMFHLSHLVVPHASLPYYSCIVNVKLTSTEALSFAEATSFPVPVPPCTFFRFRNTNVPRSAVTSSWKGILCLVFQENVVPRCFSPLISASLFFCRDIFAEADPGTKWNRVEQVQRKGNGKKSHH